MYEAWESAMTEAVTAEQEREALNTGTKEVADSHRFDEGKLANWMEANQTVVRLADSMWQY